MGVKQIVWVQVLRIITFIEGVSDIFEGYSFVIIYLAHHLHIYADSCLGLKPKIVLTLRIKVPPDGHTRWTLFAYYPHYTLNL